MEDYFLFHNVYFKNTQFGYIKRENKPRLSKLYKLQWIEFLIRNVFRQACIVDTCQLNSVQHWSWTWVSLPWARKLNKVSDHDKLHLKSKYKAYKQQTAQPYTIPSQSWTDWMKSLSIFSDRSYNYKHH